MLTLIKTYSPENLLSRCNTDYKRPSLSSFLGTPTAQGILTLISSKTKVLACITAVGARLPTGERDRSIHNAKTQCCPMRISTLSLDLKGPEREAHHSECLVQWKDNLAFTLTSPPARALSLRT
jgi:hypothetical protein